MPLFRLPVSAKRMFAGGLIAIAVLGCGAEQYDQRLRQSKDYFNYLDKIEQNLGPKWSDGRIVELLRVPRQFQQIPAPPPPAKDEEGRTEAPAVDPRQPDYINLVFPQEHLVAAWEAPFTVDTADGATSTRKGYIYVLSNYWMFLGEDPAEALKFLGIAVQHVGDALENHIPQAELEKPVVELYPKPGRYLPASSYSVFTFQPKAITDRDSTVNYTFTMYAKQNGNIQSVILVALPDRISSQEKLVDRIPMMLENFHITKTEPKPGNQSGGSAPSGGAAF